METTLRNKIQSLASKYPRAESVLLPAIALVQESSPGRYASRADLAEISAMLGLPTGRAFAVQTYYSMFNQGPVGKYHLQVDTNIPATLMGAGEIVEHLKKTLGIKVGETTPDGMFTLSAVEDLGSCGTCPVIQVNNRYYENVTPEMADKLIASLRKGKYPNLPTETNFRSECNILLKRRGMTGSTSILTYLRDGGYKTLRKALDKKPEEIVAEVKHSMVRGRGGAGFPAGVKWGFLPKNGSKPIYLICNADEGEPGTFKDRQIMEFDPHLLIEGMTIAGYGIGSKLGFIYIRGEFSWIADILERAIEEAREKHFLGADILGKGVEFDIIVHRGAGAYVCGEETALIESLEGKRGNPRLKPPFPAIAGLYGCPTIVNNVETLSCVPFIIDQGGEAFRKFGTTNNFGPKIFGISGHVNKPGVYEYQLGTQLTTLLEAAGGVKGKLKAVIAGGLSVPILKATEVADLKMDYDSCLKHGTMLGSGGIIVMNDSVSIPHIALRTIQFYAHESCGQCTPCRDGSRAIAVLLKRVVDGKAESGDLDKVLWLCSKIKGATLCPTGSAFAIPIDAMITKFRSEFEAFVK